jgi:histone demethylase JARID1
MYLASINYMHSGAPKQWYGVPGSKAKSFESTLEKLMKLRLKEVPDLMHHITTQVSPSSLMINKVPVFKTRQEVGQFIVTFPEAYHAGFSYGLNCGEAVNFATSDWIPHGSQAIVDYRLKGKKEVFSFDRLLFTLTYHLNELSLESCKMLLHELIVLQQEDGRLREHLYSAGVLNVTKVAHLPQEGRMSSSIPEELANYDDQRICTTCQHTCFLSAVCCNCRSRVPLKYLLFFSN